MKRGIEVEEVKKGLESLVMTVRQVMDGMAVLLAEVMSEPYDSSPSCYLCLERRAFQEAGKCYTVSLCQQWLTYLDTPINAVFHILTS